MIYPCATDKSLTDLSADRLADGDAHELNAHLSECSDCADRFRRLCDDSKVRRAFQLYGSATTAEPEGPAELQSLREALHRQQPELVPEVIRGRKHGRQDTLPAGTRIGHFELIRLLGTGGFARVYLARDERLDRQVALKIPHASSHPHSRAQRHQQEEGRSAARLNHPNIVAVHEFGEVDGYAFIATDYSEGPTLAEWSAAHDEPVSPATATVIVLRLADAIDHAHRNGLIHRDLKPANVLLDPNQADAKLSFSPKLTDFGLAKWVDSDATQTAHGILKGTPRYMAPEQAHGDRDGVGPGCDIYSLGVILYELLTGIAPIEGDTQVDTLRRLVSEMPIPPRRLVPAISRDLEAITMKCLEKSPTDRYRSAEALREDLRRYLAGQSTLARPLNPAQRFIRWARRNPAIASATMISIIVLSVATSVMMAKNQQLAGINHELKEVARSKAELLYAADVQLIAMSLQDGDLFQAQQLLEECVPAQGEADSRGFEWQLLQGQLRYGGTTLSGHQGNVYMVRFSPSGRMLASAGEDGTVRVRSTDNYRPLFTFSVTEREVNGIAFDPDSTRLATADDTGTVCVFDVQSQEQLLRIAAHEDLAFQVVFSPDGNWLYTCGNDREVKRWNAETGEFLGTVGSHATPLEGMALSADGRYLATACNDGGYVWECASGRMIGQHEAGKHLNMADVSISRNLWIAWATLHQGCLLEHLDESGRLTRYPAESLHHDSLQSVAFSPDGRWRASADRGGVVSLQPVPASTANRPQTNTTIVQNSMANNDSDRKSRIWKAHTGRAWSVAFSPDNTQLATGGGDGAIRIWPLTSERAFDTGNRHVLAGGIQDVAILNSRRLAVACSDSVSVWDLSDTSPVKVVLDQSRDWTRVGAVPGSNPGHQIIIAGNKSGTIRVWNARTQEMTGEWKDEAGRDVFWLGATPDGTKLFAILSGNLLTFQLPTLNRIEDLPNVWCNAAAMSPTGSLLAVANRGQDTIDLWDLTSGTILQTCSGHAASIHTLAFNANGNLLASGSGDRSVKIWNTKHGDLIQELYGHRAPVRSVSFSADSKRLLSSGEDSVTHTFALPSGRRLLTLGQHSDDLHPESKAMLSKDGTTLARLADGIVEVYDLRSGANEPGF